MSQGFDPYGAWLGIPADQRPPHAYALLGLRWGEADPGVIAAAANYAASRIHPLTAGPQAGLASQLLAEIETARRTLTNPAEKARYDQQFRPADGGDGYRRPTPRSSGGTPAGPLPMGPLPMGPMPTAPSYGQLPAPSWPAPQSYPAPYQPAAPTYPQYGGPAAAPAPAPNYSPYAAPQPVQPARYAQPTYSPPTYGTPAYSAPSYSSPGYTAAPPVSPPEAPTKEDLDTDFSAPSYASRPNPTEASLLPWMLVGAGAVLAMGLVLVLLMQQQGSPAPPVARNPPPVAPRRAPPVPALPPIRTAKNAGHVNESPRKGEMDAEDADDPDAIAKLDSGNTETEKGQGKRKHRDKRLDADKVATPAASGQAVAAPGAEGAPAVTANSGMPEAKPMVAANDTPPPADPMMKPAKGPTPEPMKAAPPALGEVPSAVELPTLDENSPGSAATPVKIAPVLLSEKQQLTLSLLDGDGATGQPGARFTLTPAGTSDAKLAWQAEYVDAENKSSPLGRFTVEDQALRFNWLGGIDAAKAQRLRNVRLALGVDREQQIVALRKAAEGESAVLNLDGFTAKYTLPGLPEANDLGLEILDRSSGVPDHKFEPSAKVSAGKETDIVFTTRGDKPTKLRFRFHLARTSANQLRVEGRTLVDQGKPQAIKIASLKQNLELLRKRKIALDGEFLDLQKSANKNNRQAMQAATDIHRQQADILTSQIHAVEDVITLCDELHDKAHFDYRVFMKVAGTEVDLVHGTTAPMAAK